MNFQKYFPYDQEENAEKYKELQKQRAMERRVRETSRQADMLEAVGDVEGAREARRKLHEQSIAYRDYSEGHGLAVHDDRLTVVKVKNGDTSYKNIYSSGLTESGGSGIINTNEKFNTKNDPMREVFGSAEISHPDEIKSIEKHFEDIGVELIREENEKLCYSPGLSPGQRGKVYISKDASYSAWLHEQKHVDDDAADGWLGMRVFADPEKCVKREIDAYEIEINLAKKANRPDIVKRLEALRDNEIEQYENGN